MKGAGPCQQPSGSEHSITAYHHAFKSVSSVEQPCAFSPSLPICVSMFSSWPSKIPWLCLQDIGYNQNVKAFRNLLDTLHSLPRPLVPLKSIAQSIAQASYILCNTGMELIRTQLVSNGRGPHC